MLRRYADARYGVRQVSTSEWDAEMIRAEDREGSPRCSWKKIVVNDTAITSAISNGKAHSHLT